MKLKDYMIREKLTQEVVAKHLSCTKNTVYRICKGVHYPSPQLASLIFEYTDGQVSYDDMYEGRNKKAVCPTCGHTIGRRKLEKMNIKM